MDRWSYTVWIHFTTVNLNYFFPVIVLVALHASFTLSLYPVWVWWLPQPLRFLLIREAPLQVLLQSGEWKGHPSPCKQLALFFFFFFFLSSRFFFFVCLAFIPLCLFFFLMLHQKNLYAEEKKIQLCVCVCVWDFTPPPRWMATSRVWSVLSEQKDRATGEMSQRHELSLFMLLQSREERCNTLRSTESGWERE